MIKYSIAITFCIISLPLLCADNKVESPRPQPLITPPLSPTHTIAIPSSVAPAGQPTTTGSLPLTDADNQAQQQPHLLTLPLSPTHTTIAIPPENKAAQQPTINQSSLRHTYNKHKKKIKICGGVVSITALASVLSIVLKELADNHML